MVNSRNNLDSLVGIAVKIKHPKALELSKKAITWLSSEGYSYCIDQSLGKELDYASDLVVPREEMTKKCSHILVLGGDGTLISVARHPADRSPVIIGVNLGTLGFMTEITAEEMLDVLESCLLGKTKLERRFLLSAKLYRQEKQIGKFSALNDVVFTKQALARVFKLKLHVDGQFATEFRGDGVIVSTPSGSTAYSLAAGGSVVHPQVHAYLITPICPHSLSSRPLVIPGNMQLKLTLSSEIKKTEDEVFLTIDGQEGTALKQGDEVTITVSKHSVLFAKSPSKNYFEVLSNKLKWTYQ